MKIQSPVTVSFLTICYLAASCPRSTFGQQDLIPSKLDAAELLKTAGKLIEKGEAATKHGEKAGEKNPAKPAGPFAELEAKVYKLQTDVSSATKLVQDSNKKTHEARIKEFDVLLGVVKKSLSAIQEGGELNSEVEKRKLKTSETLKKFRTKSTDGSLDPSMRENYKKLEVRTETQYNALVNTTIGMLDFGKLLTAKVKFLEDNKSYLADIQEAAELEEINKALMKVVEGMKEVDSGFDTFMHNLSTPVLP